MRENDGTVAGPYRIWPFHYFVEDPISCVSLSNRASPSLPLGIGGVEEALEDANDLVQRLQVLPELHLDLLLVGAELDVEVFAVRARAHGGTEDGLHEHAVVGLEGDAVGVAEGLRELVVVVGQVLAERDAGELEGSTAYPNGSVNMAPFFPTWWQGYLT